MLGRYGTHWTIELANRPVQVTGNGSFRYTDRYGQVWSTTINVPSGYTIYAQKLNKYSNALVQCNTDSSPNTGSAFAWYVGNANLSTYRDLIDMQKSGYARNYTLSGYKVFAIPALWQGSSTAYSLYARHNATGLIMEFNYGDPAFNWFGDFQEIWLDVQYMDDFCNQYAASMNASKSAKTGAITVLSASKDKAISKALKSGAALQKKTGKSPVKLTDIQAKFKKTIEAVPMTEAEAKKLDEASAKTNAAAKKVFKK